MLLIFMVLSFKQKQEKSLVMLLPEKIEIVILQLELGIRAKVRGLARLTHSFDGLKSNFFGPFIFFPVWIGPLKP
jgi:hypothetical protein